MNKKIILGLLIAAQLSVPSLMMAAQEKVLTQGKVYKFKTAPVDPYDLFHGRYLSLGVAQQTIHYPGSEQLVKRQKIYLIISEGQDGYADVTGLSFVRPKEGDYIESRVNYVHKNNVTYHWPFNRFYMNDRKALEGERIYRQANRGQNKEAYIRLRVLDGKGVIEDLYIDDRPILSYVNESLNPPKPQKKRL